MLMIPTTYQDGAVESVEAILDELHTVLAIAEHRLTVHQQKCGPDAQHWLPAAVEAFHACREHVESLQCIHDGCGSLAVWLHPDTSDERYCQLHADEFLQCDSCRQTIRLAEAVGDPMVCPACEDARQEGL